MKILFLISFKYLSWRILKFGDLLFWLHSTILHGHRLTSSFMSCVFIAYEMLNNPTTKRSYDSVDPQFDDSVPGEKVSAEKFIDTFAPVFERNSRYVQRFFLSCEYCKRLQHSPVVLVVCSFFAPCVQASFNVLVLPTTI